MCRSQSVICYATRGIHIHNDVPKNGMNVLQISLLQMQHLLTLLVPVHDA